MRAIAIAAVALACATGACSWVKVSDQGSRVAVANAANVGNCKKQSTVTVRVKDNFVGSMKRSPEKIAEELTNLARNEAALEGGNTIVPASQVADGRQTFDVYNCY